MVIDVLRGPVREVLGGLGDRALPARSFDSLVEIPVSVAAAGSGVRFRVAAVAAAAVLAIGAVGLWRLVGSNTGVVGVPPVTERWIGVPLYLPEGVALDQAGLNRVRRGVPGFEGVSDEVTVARWSSGTVSMVLVSSPLADDLVLSDGRPVDLTAGRFGTAIVDDAGVVTLGWVDAERGAALGLQTTGLSLDDVTVVAQSIWYVTPEIWHDLSDQAGFADDVEETRGYDRWRPPGSDVPHDTETEVFVRGSLQTGLRITFGVTGMGLTASGEEFRDQCRSVALDDGNDPQALLLIGDGDVSWFAVNAEGVTRTVDAEAHPGLPQLRFAAVGGDAAQGAADPDCERSR